jgi:hypothetical protein
MYGACIFKLCDIDCFAEKGRRTDMLKKLMVLFLVVALVAMGGCSKEEEKAEEERPMTYYSAKQAFARLTLYLREHKQPLPKVIWNAMPKRTALYSYGESGGLSGIVGGWVFFYKDTQGRTRNARLNCWGEVMIEEVDTDFVKIYPRAIQIHEWVLDNNDAHMVVLSRGGEGKANNFGGWLMTVDVEGRGIRPVWAGGTWNMPDKGFLIMVDAQTGELYHPISEKKLKPIALTQKPLEVEWNGGFDEKSTEALISRSEYYYWWPRAYQNFEGRYIYNRKLLQAKVQEEESKPSRSVSSWVTSGVLHSVLGKWVEAVNDLSRAIEMDPQNHDYRYYRGLIFMVIRDLDKAISDFQALPQDNKDRADALGYIAILRGKKERGGLVSFMRNIDTDVGMVPLEVYIGSVPLASRLHK